MPTDWDEIERRSRATYGATSRFVVFALVLAAALLGWARYSGMSSSSTASVPSSAIEEPSSTVLASPPTLELPATDIRAASRSAAPAEIYVGVYECSDNGQHVFSDRPCGATAKGRALVVQQPDPRDAARARQQTWQAQQSAGTGSSRTIPQQYSASQGESTAAAAGQAGYGRTCADIDRDIDIINARMRHGGYDVYEGNRLRARWHALKNERYDLRCGR